MTPDYIHSKLSLALTAYDRKQSARPGYNRYAIAHYLHAIHEAVAEIEAGKPVRAALVDHFCGRLLDIALRAVGESKSTDAEQRMRAF